MRAVASATAGVAEGLSNGERGMRESRPAQVTRGFESGNKVPLPRSILWRNVRCDPARQNCLLCHGLRQPSEFPGEAAREDVPHQSYFGGPLSNAVNFVRPVTTAVDETRRSFEKQITSYFFSPPIRE